MLTHVVAVRVLNEREGVVHELDAPVPRRVVDAALKHAATMAVRSDLDAVVRDGVVDELYDLSQYTGYK